MDVYSLEEKKQMIKDHTPKTKVVKNCAFAFLVGGAISLGAELLRRLFLSLDVSRDDSVTLVGVCLILLASVLTSLGIFDSIARFSGAGTLVPITGFSNSVTSQAIDSKSEGFILGVGSKIFTVAGPVILYGITSGAVYGVVYFISKYM